MFQYTENGPFGAASGSQRHPNSIQVLLGHGQRWKL